MSTFQGLKTTFKYNLTCIFLSLRAQLKKPLSPRTPCTFQNILELFGTFWKGEGEFEFQFRISIEDQYYPYNLLQTL